MSLELIELVQNFGHPRVLVIGDLMLDRYVWGNAERISQEAPVILLHADKREERLGGASSVATMLRALGAEVSLVGVTGDDLEADRLNKILDNLGIVRRGIVADPSRPTTVKERYIGRAQARHPQQMIRVDYEKRHAIDEDIEDEISEAILDEMKKAQVILISDYDKGVCTPDVLRRTITAARARGIRVIADPIRGTDYQKYMRCSAITPNRLEAGLATGRTLNTTEDALTAARQLREMLALEVAIVTLDKDGMALCRQDGSTEVFPTRPRQVYDITGAGDMVMAVLGLAMASGCSYEDAIRLANIAGGLEVEKIGVATVTREEIIHDISQSHTHTHDTFGATGKIVTVEELCRTLNVRRSAGQKVAFTNGCFDLLHAGHVQYLTEARFQADILVVGLNGDQSIRSLKGPDRPVNPIDARSMVLAALQAVDYVVVFHEPTPLNLIEAIRPDVLIKGSDYTKEQVVGAGFVESYGGRVHLAKLREGYSTTSLLQKMKAA